MEQYYTPMIEDKNGKRTKYSIQIGGPTKCNSPELMGHSWWENPFVNALCTMLYKTPYKVAWVGNCAEKFELYKEVMDDSKETRVVENQTKLDGKYLVNHTKQEYINCDSYKSKAIDSDSWCIHPLPLLTCIGNGMGDGDYFSKTGADCVGSWCWNIISVEDTIPDGYKELNCFFKEIDKVYVVYTSNSRELQLDVDMYADATKIIGIYSTYAKAYEQAKEEMQAKRDFSNYLAVGDGKKDYDRYGPYGIGLQQHHI